MLGATNRGTMRHSRSQIIALAPPEDSVLLVRTEKLPHSPSNVRESIGFAAFCPDRPCGPTSEEILKHGVESVADRHKSIAVVILYEIVKCWVMIKKSYLKCFRGRHSELSLIHI